MNCFHGEEVGRLAAAKQAYDHEHREFPTFPETEVKPPLGRLAAVLKR